MITRRLLPAVLALVLSTTLRAQDGAGVREAAASITPADILRRIGIIAHDSMRGRFTPSPGLEMTAAYIAGEFQRAGLKPGGDSGTFLQRYPLRRLETDTAASLIAITGGPTLRLGTDALPFLGPRAIEGSGKVVVVSGSLQEPAEAEPLDLGGRVVVLLHSPGAPQNRRNSTLLRTLAVIGVHRPVVTLLMIDAPDSLWRRTAQAALGPSVSPAWQADEPGRGAPPPVLSVRESSIRPLLEQQGVNVAALLQAAAGRARALPLDLTVSVIVRPKPTWGTSAPNVVGILEGSDPALMDDYIVFSGHMDHLGVGPPDARGDSIYNGADDDASGTVAVVELAEAFAQLNPRPRRSMIFLAVSGEERGLWGSDYFAAYPPVPIDQMVANLNTDMVGRNWKDTIVVIGKEHSDLGTTLNRVNRAHPELGMTAIDDLWPQENFYRRSDHFNFARKGVPVLFFFNGTHPDYHRPSDEVSKIDAEKESRIVKLVFYLGLDVANAAVRPKWRPESYRSIVEPTTGR
ncbi:MAG: M20/M25/M40 family metallo-hydrolase [Gemmatimonadetes bacterium]|nr:M20/M25/M40 family metallo-hydrolase [Gemmatimonadota bacterium]